MDDELAHMGDELRKRRKEEPMSEDRPGMLRTFSIFDDDGIDHYDEHGRPAFELTSPIVATRQSSYEGVQPRMVTIPAPHVQYGPQGVPEHLADADYLDHAARSLEGHFEVGGSNVRATVVGLLRDVAAALRQHPEGVQPLPLDPHPFVLRTWIAGPRHREYREGASLFHPGPEFEQDEDRYPHRTEGETHAD